MESVFKSKFKIISILAIAILILAATGCSSEKKSKKPESKSDSSAVKQPQFVEANVDHPGYPGWKKYVDGGLTVICPPDSELMARVPSICQKIKTIMTENAYRLGVKVPAYYTFFLYNNAMEIQERTSCGYTCVIDNTFHYMLFTPLGEPIMERLLRDFDPDSTPCRFCYEGLVTYLNYSGNNFVEQAYISLYNGKLAALSNLVNNDKFIKLDSASRTVAAASFVEYLLAAPWNPQKFLELYKRAESPPAALKAIYNMSIGDLEKGWHEYLKKHSGINVEQ